MARESFKRDGTTAVVAVLEKDVLYVANAGDCRAVSDRGWWHVLREDIVL